VYWISTDDMNFGVLGETIDVGCHLAQIIRDGMSAIAIQSRHWYRDREDSPSCRCYVVAFSIDVERNKGISLKFPAIEPDTHCPNTFFDNGYAEFTLIIPSSPSAATGTVTLVSSPKNGRNRLTIPLLPDLLQRGIAFLVNICTARRTTDDYYPGSRCGHPP
jgi:hypothetical protein